MKIKCDLRGVFIMDKQQFGVIGMGVMGKNLALNVESRGFSVSVYNRNRIKTDELLIEDKRKKYFGNIFYRRICKFS